MSVAANIINVQRFLGIVNTGILFWNDLIWPYVRFWGTIYYVYNTIFLYWSNLKCHICSHGVMWYSCSTNIHQTQNKGITAKRKKYAASWWHRQKRVVSPNAIIHLQNDSSIYHNVLKAFEYKGLTSFSFCLFILDNHYLL